MIRRAYDCHPMDILLLLIPVSVVLVLLIGAAFWWSVRSGQFDDLEGPAHRILADDDTPPESEPRGTGVDTIVDDGAGLTSINPGTGRGT
jgi:cbb3-type cytochrome oxidase maturation protein